MRISIVTCACVLALAAKAAAYEWHAEPAPPGHLFGPAFWIQGEQVALHVNCFRYSSDIQHDLTPSASPYDLVLAPRRMSVSVIWAGSEAPPADDVLVGTTGDPRDSRPAPISFRVDEGVWDTQEWPTLFGRQHRIEGDAVVGFMRHLLPPATQLSVRARFVDSGERYDTFDVTPVSELLAEMEPDCPAVRPLLVPTATVRDSQDR